jgi:hypothetical protein
MSRSLLALLLLTTLFTVACVPPVGDDDDSAVDDDDDDVFDVTGYDVIEYDLTVKSGEAMKGEDDAESVFHVMRYWLDTPMRIVAIGAMFNVRGGDDQPAHLALYPDQGHNFHDFLRETPFVEWDLDLNKDEHDEVWRVYPLDEPVDISFPQPIYVGSHYRGEEGQPVLAKDEAPSDDPYMVAAAPNPDDWFPPYLATLPDRGTDTYGFETTFWGGSSGMYGDLMVRLYVERYDVVEPEDTWFVDATDDGLGLSGSGAVSFGDCNDDGWIDVWDGRLRVNAGDGTFEDTTDAAGIASGGNALWGDYDNDGDLDLFMATTADKLWRNEGDCTFVDVTEASGIDDTQSFSSDPEVGAVDQHLPTVAAAWLDYDGDGLLDLMQGGWGSFSTEDYGLDYLWHNEGDGSFVNVSEELDMLWFQGSGRAGRTVTTSDWDADGDMDVYVGNYRLQRNHAYLNEGDEFTDAGNDSPLEGHESGTPPYYSYGHAIGAAWGDVDNDNDFDLFVGNLAHPRFIGFSDKSMMLTNQLSETGVADFIDTRDEAGLIYQETDSSPIFDDFDNDGDLDLFYTAVYPARPSYYYSNNGDGTFELDVYPAGTWIYNGWGVSSADIDNDGDRDIYGGRLLINEHPQLGGNVRVRVVGSGTGATNVSGIGAIVRLATNDGTQAREVTAGVGTGCQQPLEQSFGLGLNSSATVEVTFPVTGTVISAGAVAPGDRIVVYEDGVVLDR